LKCEHGLKFRLHFEIVARAGWFD